MKIEFTKQGFEEFCYALNHRMSQIERDIKWIKRLGYYMGTVFTALAIKILFIGG